MTKGQQIEEYKVIASTSYKTLSDEINEQIADGWQPFGSLSVVRTSIDSGGINYIHGMVKYK